MSNETQTKNFGIVPVGQFQTGLLAYRR